MLSFAMRCNAGAQKDQTVLLKDLHRCVRVHACKHTQVRHHEDGILRQFRETFGLETIDQHERGLLHAWRVAEHAA